MIKLGKENKEKMIWEIQKYFSEERDEDLGDLAASLILGFVMDKLAPKIYDQGIQDAQTYMNEKVMDMFELEKS